MVCNSIPERREQSLFNNPSETRDPYFHRVSKRNHTSRYWFNLGFTSASKKAESSKLPRNDFIVSRLTPSVELESPATPANSFEGCMPALIEAKYRLPKAK
jgi:hypothetical protein